MMFPVIFLIDPPAQPIPIPTVLPPNPPHPGLHTPARGTREGGTPMVRLGSDVAMGWPDPAHGPRTQVQKNGILVLVLKILRILMKWE